MQAEATARLGGPEVVRDQGKGRAWEAGLGRRRGLGVRAVLFPQGRGSL